MSLLSQFSSEIANLAASAAPSTVAITGRGRAASGFFWRPTVVVTASEALDAERGATIEVLSSAGRIPMTFAGRDPSTDIAILTSAATTGVALALATGPVKTGEVTIVAGRSAHGTSSAVGFVSLAGDAWESMRGGRIDSRLRLGTRLERHQEGGPVLNAEGAVIGMAVFGPHRRTLVIPSSTIERIATTLLTDGRIKRGYLGIAGQPVRPQLAKAEGSETARFGLLVLHLDTGGPAHRAGFLQGDIITAIGDKPIGSPRQLRRSLTTDMVGQTLACNLIRAGQPMTLDVTIADRHAAPSQAESK